MKIIILISLISFLIFISCCKTLFPDEKLTLLRKNYMGNELKMDGYYYVFRQNNYANVYFFYRNGVFLSVGHSYSSQDLDFLEKEIRQEERSNYKSKDHWGVFLVDGNSIQYEKWVGSTGIRACLCKCTGHIENDTTIHFTERYYSETKKALSIDEVWHFKQFSPKPDSTNVYIK